MDSKLKSKYPGQRYYALAAILRLPPFLLENTMDKAFYVFESFIKNVKLHPLYEVINAINRNYGKPEFDRLRLITNSLENIEIMEYFANFGLLEQVEILRSLNAWTNLSEKNYKYMISFVAQSRFLSSSTLEKIINTMLSSSHADVSELPVSSN